MFVNIVLVPYERRWLGLVQARRLLHGFSISLSRLGLLRCINSPNVERGRIKLFCELSLALQVTIHSRTCLELQQLSNYPSKNCKASPALACHSAIVCAVTVVSTSSLVL